MQNYFLRSERLIGKKALKKLENSKVAVFGVGGVGSFAVEGLVRGGVYNFILIDNDVVCDTNINRQIHATTKTIGRPKVEVMKERILDINPKAKVKIYQKFYLPGLFDELISGDVDFIVDAVDTVTAKIDLIINAKEKGIPIISSMGTGNKLDPTRLRIADIYGTSVCPLAKVMRHELRARGVDSLTVVYSDEEVKTGFYDDIREENIKETKNGEREVPGSVSFVPSVAGLIIAGEVIKGLIKELGIRN